MLIELKIQDISSDGRGVARTPEGRVVMVDQTLPGDIAEVSLDLEAKGSVLSGTLTRMIESSVNRIDHPCEFACKGCISSPLGSLKYDAQLKWKESHLRETLKRISKRTLPEISTINPSPKIWNYRERVELHLGVSTLPSSDTPKLTLGYLHKQSIIPIEYCHLAVETVNDTVKKVSANMESLAGIDLSELLAKNPLRLMIRDNGKNGTLAILFFDEKVPQKYLPIFKEWLSRSVSNFELRQVESYAFRYLNSTTIDKQGDGTVQYPIGEHPPITLPSTVFTQTNHSVAELLQREVIRLLPSGKPIIDLYGGFGVFSILHDWKSKTSSDVIESSTESVQSGREYVTQNHLKTNFVKRHLGNRMIPEKVLHRNKSVVLDPPRAGGGKKIMSQLNASGCKNIVYVSCHPAALARDIQLLTNYKIQSIQPFDMFPHTPELETVMHLTTKK